MKLIMVVVFLVAPLQAREWAVGVDVFYPHLVSLWNTGEKWGYDIALGGPTIGKDSEEDPIADVEAAFTVHRFKGRAVFFATTGWEYFQLRFYELIPHHRYGLRIGTGISRKYKDLRISIYHGLEVQLYDNDGNRSWSAGFMHAPRVVASWTL